MFKFMFMLMMMAMMTMTAEGRRVREGEPVKIDFDPALTGGRPTLTIVPLEGADGFEGAIHVKAYMVKGDAWREAEEEIPTRADTITGLEQYELMLPVEAEGPEKERPAVKTEGLAAMTGALVVGVRVAIHPKGEAEPRELAHWRALYWPEGEVMQYAGAPGWEPPEDFDAYWRAAREKLALAPMQPKIEAVPEKDTPTGRLYKVTLNSYLNIPIICWYYVPKDVDVLGVAATEGANAGTADGNGGPKRYPAIMAMPGWGAEEPPNDKTAEGYITLSVNPRGHGPSAAFFKTPVDHHLWNIDVAEDYYYRAAYMDGVRALDFLASRPEVDAGRIGIWGGSQGGAFALAMGGLDGRVACVASNVTYLSNFPDFVRLGTLGSGPAFGQMARREDIGARVRRTLGYVDVAHMAGRVTAPTLVCVGRQDPVCPPVNGIVAFNHLPGATEKKLFVDPEAEHENSPAMMERVWAWMDAHLKPAGEK